MVQIGGSLGGVLGPSLGVGSQNRVWGRSFGVFVDEIGVSIDEIGVSIDEIGVSIDELGV